MDANDGRQTIKDGDLQAKGEDASVDGGREKERKKDDRRRRKRSRRDDKKSNRRRRRRSTPSDDDSSEEERKRRQRKRKSRKKKKRREPSSSEEPSDDSEPEERRSKKKVVNKRLVEKLAARGETLQEREERRSQRRAARITAKFGYTAEENPFNDPNLHEAFTWKKREESSRVSGKDSKQLKQDEIFGEIEKVRKRRQDREQQFEEMERIKAEENRMRELENYDEWARKEEEFHLLQQRQRSAIRLVEGREKPIDVLAKNMLMFGLSEKETESRARVKYQEKYSALNEVETLEAELDEPQHFMKVLKLDELEELLLEIDTFRRLEREALGGFQGRIDSPILHYWDNIFLVASDEIKFLKDGGDKGSRASTIEEVKKLFEGQSPSDLDKLKGEIEQKLTRASRPGSMNAGSGEIDVEYWRTVLEQLQVHNAKLELSGLHRKMLSRQLERLDRKKQELEAQPASATKPTPEEESKEMPQVSEARAEAKEDSGFEDLDEELGLGDESELAQSSYSWQDKFRPRKPRYFNRVKCGYDWNKYNQTHYDHDNPPPKTVQGYKFNIFYPDLIDRTKTPQYFLEPADSDEFCIIRFHAGPPYEDIAFKILNREWNRSRKKGFRCTFERGVLSLYFNFTTHWYRR